MRTVLSALLLVSLAAASAASPESATITSTGFFTTADGKEVHAHGAGIILPESHPAGHTATTGDPVYYMVGTTKKHQPGWLSGGINVYSSTDLQHWTFEHEILKNTSITTPIPAGEAPHYRIERPKIIYNANTRKYVMWFHLDSVSFKMGMVGVATCDNVAGDYVFVSGFRPDGQRSLDMGLFQDLSASAGTDGAAAAPAYLVRSVDNEYAGLSRLSDDYLRPTGIISRGPRCEGQAMWRDGDRYYLLGSHLTGWSANAAILSTTTAPLRNGSSWEVLGNPSGSPTTWDSQSTFVLPYTHPDGRKLHIYMGDRWNGHGEDGGVGNASYVWLPLVSTSAKGPGSFTMPFLPSWKIADFPAPGPSTATPSPSHIPYRTL